MEKTLLKFGYPETLIYETEFWYLLLRPKQVTLGSLILIEKTGRHRFSEISSQSVMDMGKTIKRMEQVLFKLFNYEKINYLMLMMLDPEVHFHVIPRYSTNQSFQEFIFKDEGWPGLPNLARDNPIKDDLFNSLLVQIKAAFSQENTMELLK